MKIKGDQRCQDDERDARTENNRRNDRDRERRQRRKSEAIQIERQESESGRLENHECGGFNRQEDAAISKQWHAFVHLAEPGESTTPASAAATRSRLLSGAGNRYDYWRIAWHVWREHPLAGMGAGNYPRPYFERRSTTEDVQQPHSLELQVLSELGLVGAALLACLLGGVAWGAMRMRRPAARSRLARGLVTAAVGAFARRVRCRWRGRCRTPSRAETSRSS